MINIIDKTKCCGCFGCANVCPKHCITMKEDSEGFQYPNVNVDDCIDCHLCEKICPVINAKNDAPKLQRAFLLQHKDETILKESTSGGAFTIISSWVIYRGGVVFGAAFDHNFEVTHQYAENIKDLYKFRNSKYVQSFMGDAYKNALQFLKSGRLVCFSGTPCQLEGLLNYLQKPYKNLITVDIMCHSVTSPGVFRSYRKMREVELKDKPDKYMFRDKIPYGYKYSTMSVWSKGKQVYSEGVETDKYLRSFLSDINVRPSCYDCKFKKRYHLTDFTIWDCFNVAKFNKDFDNDKGVTRILVNSESGAKILGEMRDEARIFELNVDFAVEGVKEMKHSVAMNPKRELWFRDFASTNGSIKTWNDYFPVTFRTRLEKYTRAILVKFGVYMKAKEIIKFFVKDPKRN